MNGSENVEKLIMKKPSRDDLKAEGIVLLMIAKTEKSENAEKLMMKRASRNDLKVEEKVLR